MMAGSGPLSVSHDLFGPWALRDLDRGSACHGVCHGLEGVRWELIQVPGPYAPDRAKSREGAGPDRAWLLAHIIPLGAREKWGALFV